MKHIKTVKIPETTRRFVDYRTCDLCAERIVEGGCDVDEVTVSYKTGVDTPGGGGGTIDVIDLCKKCFKEKLLPWLKAQGVEPCTEEWER